jgi:hypothetical protein
MQSAVGLPKRYGQHVKWGNPANPGFKGGGGRIALQATISQSLLWQYIHALRVTWLRYAI